MQRLLALSVMIGREFSPLSCGEAIVCHIGKVKLAVKNLFFENVEDLLQFYMVNVWY